MSNLRHDRFIIQFPSLFRKFLILALAALRTRHFDYGKWIWAGVFLMIVVALFGLIAPSVLSTGTVSQALVSIPASNHAGSSPLGEMISKLRAFESPIYYTNVRPDCGCVLIDCFDSIGRLTRNEDHGRAIPSYALGTLTVCPCRRCYPTVFDSRQLSYQLTWKNFLSADMEKLP